MERQGLFIRSGQYVAVRPIKLSSNVTVEPGADVTNLRVFQLRYLFRNRRIGLKGSKWTKQMLALLELGREDLKPEITDVESLQKPKEVEKVRPKPKPKPKPPTPKNKDD